LIIREAEPRNLEFPFPTLDSAITPSNRFFVRSHFKVPEINLNTWRLQVDGAVRRVLDLSHADLARYPTRTVATTLECAGNGRALLIPKARGLLWELGAVGNAEWTGVSLADVLQDAGVREEALEVVLEGADRGEVTDDPKSPGPIAFERSLPMTKALKPEVLLATRMNGRDLPTEHGWPLRAVVPGWYGMASVKWLKRLTVTLTPFQGFWQTTEYSYWNRVEGRPTQVPVTAMRVKSQVARPALGEVVPAGSTYRVRGAAWAGESEVARVELSTDGGQTWSSTRLLGESVPFCWRLWEFDWKVPNSPGKRRLLARATDVQGRTQPLAHDRDRKAYMIHHALPIDLEVR
jgi:DMSO/TMAO reductase YedYZ molybdopterin-dependent catalytic subunit